MDLGYAEDKSGDTDNLKKFCTCLVVCGLCEKNICFTPSSAHRVQKSDAGVGIGTLIGDRDYLAQE